MTGRAWWLACAIVLAAALGATLPTTGDLGLTWDEPAYRYSQEISAQWWERLGRARSVHDLAALVDPDALLYYWPYGRHGINFHPPLAGQLNLATHALLGRWMKDIPSRRVASVLEYVLTIAIGFGFLSRRYGAWVGGVMAGSLLALPRVYGQAHLAETDTPGLLLWALTAVAFWKGLNESNAGRWRVLVGVLLGLAFLEKMAAVIVIVPLVVWLVAARLPATFSRAGGRADWIDGVATSVAMLVPLGAAFLEILRLSKQLPAPAETNLFVNRPPTYLPGAILSLPLLVWLVRRGLGRAFRTSPVWGAERPAFETWTAILAFAPVVGWLGNPAWWRETLPRLAHYYLLNTDRKGALPDIQILYLGKTYLFSLPWHNAWVLIAVTVPATILAAALVGMASVPFRTRRDRLPLYFLIHFLTLPFFRMLPTPAHDGVRLILPAFFFLAAFAGWGAVLAADALARGLRVRPAWTRAVAAALVLVPAGWQLVKVHPFELSYYNELIGGPRGARRAGFELTYWYDAFNDKTLAAINDERVLPRGAAVDFLNEKTQSCPVFGELQTLGHLRGDLYLATRSADEFPYAWLLTQDSKASPFTRLLFAMKPVYVLEPRQLDGLRVASVVGPVGVSRAWALNLLACAPDGPPPGPRPPGWVERYLPALAPYWREGATPIHNLRVNEPVFEWARSDPGSLRAAARAIAARRPFDDDSDAARLMRILTRFDHPGQSGGLLADRLLRARPQALTEAVEVLIARPAAVRAVLTREAYTLADEIGGYLDQGL